MTVLRTASFWIQSAERSVKTAAQTFVAVWGASGLTAFDATVPNMVWISLTGGVLSIVTSVASIHVGDDTPSLV